MANFFFTGKKFGKKNNIENPDGWATPTVFKKKGLGLGLGTEKTLVVLKSENCGALILFCPPLFQKKARARKAHLIPDWVFLLSNVLGRVTLNFSII